MAFLQEYTMLDELGKGGFATVYKVRHNELGYIRAIRVLNETIVNQSSKTYQKFLRECKVLLRLGNGNHPFIVHIYQPRLLENKALVEMDYVDGQDIAHYLKKEQNFVSSDEVVCMAVQMGSALAYCHEDIYRYCMDRDLDHLEDDPNDGSKVLVDDATRQRLIAKYKVIHNDIHSGNIIRREDGSYVLLDFGLAISGDEVVHSSRHANGAPEFKAPEKWDDESVLTEQSDIYSFGIVLYQYLAGRVPFPFNAKSSNRTEAEYQLCKAHQNTPPPSIEMLRKECFENKYAGKTYQKDYPGWLEAMILKCLEKNPADRFHSGKDLYEYIVAHVGENAGTFDEVGMARIGGDGSDAASLRAQLDDLQEKLADKTSRLLNVEQQLAETTEQKNELQTRLAKQGRTVKFTTTLIILFAVVCSVLGIKLMSMPQEREPFVWEQSAEVKSLKEHVGYLEQTIEGKDKEIYSLKKKLSSNTSPAPNAGKDNSAEIASLKLIVAEKEKLIKEKDNKIKSLQGDLDRASNNSTSDVARLKATITEKENRINSLQASLKTAQNDLETVRGQLAKAQSSNSGNMSEVAALQKKVYDKEKEIATLNTKLSKAKSEASSLQTKLDMAKKEISVLREQLSR